MTTTPQFEMTTPRFEPLGDDAKQGEDARNAARWRPGALLTFACLGTLSMIEGAEVTALPAVFGELGCALGASPTQLGALTCLRGIAQSIVALVAGAILSEDNGARDKCDAVRGRCASPSARA